MHRSRIGVVLVDHPVESYDAAAAFWASARGSDRRGDPNDADDPYESLDPVGGLHLELQRTGSGTPARVHLDIESDDVTAEVNRLEALGGRVADLRDDYAIMEDPGGLVFCVVPVQGRADFDANATTWR
ncbi:MAG TPA: VOC family protein [Nocardioides sp.]|uniref:VOC family protein n=1 Tax=Nocardioides sp. TaxID=35761 RepID=UPI002E357D1D|nr:VOC family protein [Nocardioides sp.]HEX3932268.1 VOC family protein [Nocardioides sp.]